MKIIRDLARLEHRFPYPVVTLGNYDGVHLGHQQIFQKLVERAKKMSGTSVIFTFEPHPLRVLSPSTAPPLLNTFRRKMELFETYGIDVVICAEFTREFAATPPEDFIKNILVGRIGVREILVGYDYAFGRGKQGTTDAMTEMGKRYGFQVDVIPAFILHEEVISTTRLRELVRQGEIRKVCTLLGRCYASEGIVVAGDHRGKTLGFPTANLQSHNELFPKQGVYAVQVEYRDRLFDGVANIGTHPTFGEGKVTIEVHIFDFHEEIYGQFVRVLYRGRLRDEKTFDKRESLVRQIHQDIEEARRVLQIYGEKNTSNDQIT